MTTTERSDAPTTSDDLLDAARAIQPDVVAIRRRIHRHPEMGLHLPETQEVIVDELARIGVEGRRGTSLSSVVAVIEGGRSGPTVLLRGDMDALPLHEDTGLDYASEVDGTMHACGHDTHVAMLASAARLLCERRDGLAGRGVFMFQPGEEGQHGARYMLEEGLLDAAGRRVEKALAIHITSTLRTGVITCRPGPIMASADTFHVTVTGRGGHGGMPHDAIDPVPPTAAMVGALQTMVARRISVHEPAVVTIAHLTAGTTTNIIPETALLEGTIRTLSATTRALVHKELRQVCEHTAAAHGCTAEVTIIPGYPVTVND